MVAMFGLFLWLYRLLLKFLTSLHRLLPHVLPEKVAWYLQHSQYHRAHSGTVAILEHHRRAAWIWLHAASGEFEHLRPLLQKIKSHFPDLHIAVTQTSPSLIERLQRIPGVDSVLCSPLDIHADVLAFIGPRPPLALVIAKSDWWPVTLQLLSSQNVPIFAVAHYPLLHSGLRGVVERYLLKQISAHMTEIFASSSYEESTLSSAQASAPLASLFSCPINITGDPRWDQVWNRAQSPSQQKDASTLQTQALVAAKLANFKNANQPRQKIAVLASTWPEDDAQWFDVFGQFPNLQWLWIPHEPTQKHIENFCAELEKRQITHSLWQTPSWKLNGSCYQASHTHPQIEIVNTTGMLFEIYRHCDLAFLGGSFKKRVHSILEPLAFGRPVLVGPHINNSPEGKMFQKVDIAQHLQAVTVCHNASELQSQLQHLLHELDTRHQDMQQIILQNFREHLGATEKIAQQIFLAIEQNLTHLEKIAAATNNDLP